MYTCGVLDARKRYSPAGPKEVPRAFKWAGLGGGRNLQLCTGRPMAGNQWQGEAGPGTALLSVYTATWAPPHVHGSNCALWLPAWYQGRQRCARACTCSSAVAEPDKQQRQAKEISNKRARACGCALRLVANHPTSAWRFGPQLVTRAKQCAKGCRPMTCSWPEHTVRSRTKCVVSNVRHLGGLAPEVRTACGRSTAPQSRCTSAPWRPTWP